MSGSSIVNQIGITRDLKTKELMLIMNYAKGGDLHKYLQKEFANITWEKKLYTLRTVSRGYLYPNLLTNKFNIIFVTNYHF